MTDNLQNKFGSLESQLTTQHNALMDALTGIGNKLDTIASALGAPPPTASVTLADVLAVLRDIHTDTISQDQKLLRIRDAISPLADDPPAGSLVGIQWLLYRLVDAINPTWPRPTSYPIQPAVSALYTQFAPLTATWWESRLGVPATVNDNVLHWLQSLGTPTGDATTTVLGRLAAINFATAGAYSAIGLNPPETVTQLLTDLKDCGCSGKLTAANSPCASPYTSSEVTNINLSLIPGFSNFNIARFPASLPNHLHFGTVFGLSVDRTEISVDAAGCQFYVESDAKIWWPSPLQANVYPTNQWLVFNPNVPTSFIVPFPSNITVHICPPVEWGWGTGGGGSTLTLNSVAVVNNGNPAQAIAWPDGGTSTLPASVAGQQFDSDHPIWLLSSDSLRGKSLRLVPSTAYPNNAATMYYESPRGNTQISETPFVVPVNFPSGYIAIVAAYTAPFTLEISSTL